MKKILICMLTFFSGLLAQDIQGFWKTIDEKSGKPQCVVAVYEYENKYYGRIVGTFNDKGVMDETLDAPSDRAPGLVGKPFYCGLDLIWNLKKGSKCKGKIVDPKKGNIYRAEVWVEDGNLIVRGKLLCFGRNQTWLPASDADFPSTFKKPDVTKFVPVIPEVD
jgi:uncharacterized protein (DUF2147 family)